MARRLYVMPDRWQFYGDADWKVSSEPVGAAWLAADAGSVIELAAGTYNRVTLKKSSRAAGGPPVVIDGVGLATISRAPEVGGSDTINLKQGVRDLTLKRLVLEACSRAAIKTEQPGGARKVNVLNCVMLGGFNPNIPGSTSDTKWGSHDYFTGSVIWLDSVVAGIYQEHARYLHTLQGNHYYGGTVVQHCGLTALQEVNRIHENGTPQPAGYGDVTLESEVVTDVCLGGGAAYSFRGGRPGGKISLLNTQIRLGSTPGLALEWQGKAAGAILVDMGKESSPGKGDGPHPGKYSEVVIDGCVVDVGSVYQPVGGARRSSVVLGNCELARIVGGSFKASSGLYVIEVNGTCDTFKIASTTVVDGKIKYKGAVFNTLPELIAAHPEVAA